MEVVPNSYMPGDPRLVEQLVYELKSQGIFDQFRKECIADVDTKPAYQNLRQRVEGSVTSFLKQQTWRPDMNKNQVREQVRKNIYESGYLETGVERIVDQVVNPKINTIFLPQVEDVVYRYLGIEKPNRYDVRKELKIDVTDLLPTDLEAISPESDHTKDDSLNFNDSLNSESKMEEDESPPFEPINVQIGNIQPEENSMDSHLSGFSGLQSHDSNPCMESKISQMELSNQDSQVSQNSLESRLSIITSEDNTKMDIREDSNSKLLKSSDSSSQMEICPANNSISVDPNSIEVDEEVKDACEAESSNDNNGVSNVVDESIVEIQNEEKPEDKITDCIKNKQMDDKQNEDKKSSEKRNIDDKQNEDKKSSEKKNIDDKQNEDKKSSEKKIIDNKQNEDKKSSEKKNTDDKQNEDKKNSEKKNTDDKQNEYKKNSEKKNTDDKQNEEKKSTEKKHTDKKYKSLDKSSDKYNSKDKRDDKHRKSSSSKEKEKSNSKYSSSSSFKDRDKTKEKKESRSSSNSSNNKDRNDKEDYKNDKDRDKIKSDKEKERSEKDKDKKEKDKYEKDKTDKSKSVKEKDKSAKDKDKLKSSISGSSSSVVKNSTNKEKDKSSSNVKSNSSKKDKEKSRLSSSSSSKDSKSKSNDSKSKSSSSDKHKKDDKSTHNIKHSSSSSSSSKRDKDKKKVSKKDMKDDHYSSKDKKNDRRSTDRDSNDGRSGRQSQINSFSDSNSSQVQKTNRESSNSNSRSGSGDSGTSDQSEHTVKSPIKIIEQNDNKEILTSYVDTQKFKYIKPKFASNFQEARKLMKIRKQLAKLERHNQLSLAQIEVPTEIPIVNGINCLKEDNSRTETEGNNRKKVEDINRKEVDDSNRKEVKDNNRKEVKDSNRKEVEDNNRKEVEDNNRKEVEDNNRKEVEENNRKDVEDNNRKEVEDNNKKEVEDNNKKEVEDNNDDEENVDELKENFPSKVQTLEISECKMSPKDDSLLLQSKELSKENWEALEARLAQEMSNINYDSYESPYDDDYGECKSMNLIKTKINDCVVEEKVKQFAGPDSNKAEKNEAKNVDEHLTASDRVVNNITEQREKNSTYDSSKDLLSKDNQRNSTEQNEHFQKDVTKIKLVDKDESDTARKVESDIAVDKDDSQRVIENNDKADNEENTLNSDSDSSEPCFYLEPFSPRLNENLQFLYKYIDKLEKEVEHSLKTFQNNFVPVKQRHRKRKLVENVDLRNNNKAHFEQTTDVKKRRRSVAPNPNSVVSKANKEKLCNSSDISPNDSFSLPLSPAESDKSNEKKEEESPKAKQKREKVGKGIHARSQRYSSEDLYKPRPIFMSSRRSRGAKNVDK